MPAQPPASRAGLHGPCLLFRSWARGEPHHDLVSTVRANGSGGMRIDETGGIGHNFTGTGRASEVTWGGCSRKAPSFLSYFWHVLPRWRGSCVVKG